LGKAFPPLNGKQQIARSDANHQDFFTFCAGVLWAQPTAVVGRLVVYYSGQGPQVKKIFQGKAYSLQHWPPNIDRFDFEIYNPFYYSKSDCLGCFGLGPT